MVKTCAIQTAIVQSSEMSRVVPLKIKQSYQRRKQITRGENLQQSFSSLTSSLFIGRVHIQSYFPLHFNLKSILI